MPSHAIGQPPGDYQTTTLPGWGELATSTKAAAQGPPRKQLTLQFNLPFGQASSLLGLLNTMKITIQVRDGEIGKVDIESEIRETFQQIGIKADIK